MKYKFNKHKKEIRKEPFEQKEVPVVEIDNASLYGDFFDSEINHIEMDYAEEIVEKIEEVLSGKINFYEGFGFELYMIECDREKAVVKNIFEDDRVEAVIPIQEVYELMRDWRDYLREFYKQKTT